jgi:hypothetical protein
MIEEDEKVYQAEQAAKAQAQTEAKAQASSSNSSNVATNNSSSNDVANDTSNSGDTSSNDTSGSDSSSTTNSSSSDSQYIKAISLMSGRDLTSEWKLTWDVLEPTSSNPQIYFMRYSGGSPTAKGRFYVFNKDKTIVRMNMESRFVPEDEGFENAVASVWNTALRHGID